MVNEMVMDGVYEVENAGLIAKTYVKLLRLVEIQTILHSARFSEIAIYRKRKSAWNAIVAKRNSAH